MKLLNIGWKYEDDSTLNNYYGTYYTLKTYEQQNKQKLNYQRLFLHASTNMGYINSSISENLNIKVDHFD